jgi:putative MATE family efflux protein
MRQGGMLSRRCIWEFIGDKLIVLSRRKVARVISAMSPRPLALTTDPIPQLTWRIALPASVGMFFNTMFNFVDTYCAGLLSTEALAALSLSFPLFFLLISIGSGLSQGATALLANALGANDRAAARSIFAQSLLFAVVIGLILSGLGWLGAPSLFRWLGAEGSYLDLAVTYMRVILCGGVFFVLVMTLNAGLVAQGETRVYRNVLITGFFANCLLNPIFMWGWLGMPAMGVGGIALATVFVQIGSSLYLWQRLRFSELFRTLPRNLFRPDLAVLRQIVAQSVPSALNMMTIALGILVITWFVQHFGSAAVAATGIATRIEQMILLPVIGLSSAVLSIVGQNHGAGLSARVREAWWMNLKIGAGLMVIGGLLLWWIGEFMILWFTQDAEVIRYSRDYLRVAAVTLPAYPILFVTVFMMQGLKRPAYGLWIGLYRQVAAPLVVMNLFCFQLGWGLNGIWWAIFCVNWSAALFAVWWGGRVMRDMNSSPLTPTRVNTKL